MFVNGLQVTLDKSISISEFLKQEGYNVDRVALEKNHIIVPQKNFDTEHLTDDDRVEIVQFVGGG